MLQSIKIYKTVISNMLVCEFIMAVGPQYRIIASKNADHETFILIPTMYVHEDLDTPNNMSEGPKLRGNVPHPSRLFATPRPHTISSRLTRKNKTDVRIGFHF